MNTKKYIIIASVTATMLAGAFSLVFAQDTMTIQPNPEVMGQKDSSMAPKMILQIGPSGRTLLRGIVKAVGTDFVIVTSWGGGWTVKVSGDTKLMPQGATLAQIGVGDFVGIQGKINQDMPWTVSAELLRDWTVRKTMQENRTMMQSQNSEEKKGENAKTMQESQGNRGTKMQQQIQAILKQIEEIRARISTQQGQTTPQTSSGQ
jgi:hypothetical protein